MSLRWCQPKWWNIIYGEILCMAVILSIYLMPITVRYNMWAIMYGHYYVMGNYYCCCCCCCCYCCCCCFNGLVYNWANRRLCTTCWSIGLILINEKAHAIWAKCRLPHYLPRHICHVIIHVALFFVQYVMTILVVSLHQ
jgi:hypothetical protein